MANRILTDRAAAELNRLFTNLENSADDTGCTDDLVVISKSALEGVAEAFGTWPELNPEKRSPTVSIETAIGELRCEVHSDPDYPGLTVYWNERQIAVIERSPDTSMMRVMVWDTDAEDPSSHLPVFPGYGEEVRP